jgi:hypothetical protein
MTKQKPTVYLDTNIPSVLCYRGSHIGILHQQMVTREWWDAERQWFRLYASGFAEGELGEGVYPGQEQALKLVRRLPYLPLTAEVRECAQVFLGHRLIPAERRGDAVQLALATIHGIDYLLTWNYAHLVNLDTQRRLKRLNEQRGWRSVYLVSPETIPRVSLGQAIRRRDDDDS